MRTDAVCVAGLGFRFRPLGGSATTDPEAQMPEIATLPAFATTRTTETCLVGGRTEVAPAGGTCSVVVVVEVDVDVVVDVEVEGVVDDVDAPGRVVDVVVLVDVVVEVDVEVVDVVVVVVGRPVIRTTGGCTVTATIVRSSRTCSLGMLDSRATQVVTDAALHAGGSPTQREAGRRPRPLAEGRESTKER